MQTRASVESQRWRVICLIHQNPGKWVCLLFHGNGTRRWKRRKCGIAICGMLKQKCYHLDILNDEIHLSCNIFQYGKFIRFDFFFLLLLNACSSLDWLSQMGMFDFFSHRLNVFISQGVLKNKNKTITQQLSSCGPIGAPCCQTVHMGQTTHRARKRATSGVTARKKHFSRRMIGTISICTTSCQICCWCFENHFRHGRVGPA